MKALPPEEKLQMIEDALDHFYDIDTETLVRNYQEYLDTKMGAASRPMDRETAIAYFGAVPDNCYGNKPLDMKPEMLRALSEEEFQALCEEQAKSHPDVQQEIRSMFDFCLRIKRLL